MSDMVDRAMELLAASALLNVLLLIEVRRLSRKLRAERYAMIDAALKE